MNTTEFYDGNMAANEEHFMTEQSTTSCSAKNTSCSTPSSAISPTSPSQRVGFSTTSPLENTYEKDRVRFLTAKYPKHQMGLIRKRLAVEDWIDEELKNLFDVSDVDNETYDTIIDLDELLNYDTDSDRAVYIQQKIADAQKSEAILKKFVEDLLAKANTL